MSPELLKKILDAIASGDEKAQAALLPEIVASVAAEESGEPAGGADPMAAAADPAPVDPNAPPKKPAMAASKGVSALAKALGCATDEDAAQAVAKLQKTVADHEAANAAVELATRRSLVADLVKLRVEFPATAWKDPKTLTPADHLMLEPIASLRKRVDLHKAEAAKHAPIEAPETGPVVDIKAEVAKLSKDILKQIKDKGLTPEQFVEQRNKATRRNY